MSTCQPSPPDFFALADESRRIESRVVGVSTRANDHRMVLFIELADATRAQPAALGDALRAFRGKNDLSAEFILVNTSGGGFVVKPNMPSGWPP